MMPFVYRYIDLEKQEVVYIGKVTKGGKEDHAPLRRRHEQHMREEWYKKNADNIAMQFIEVDSQADADIFETWLISKYGTGQLVNISKCGWGESKLDMWALTAGHWRTYQRGCWENADAVHELADMLYKHTEGLTYDVDSSLGVFCEMVDGIVKEKDKATRLSQYGEQEDFRRLKAKCRA